MEILIIGGVLVALMVLVSTKIKKSAAQAFESEIIETEEFRLIKPAGFVHPLREVSDYVFEAYSKDFGEKNERNIWRAQVYMTVLDGLHFNSVRKDVKKEDGKILSEKFPKGNADSEKIYLIEKETSKDDTAFLEFREIVESRKQQKTYDLKILVLKSFRQDFVGRVDELVSSFQLK
ncbi:MAG: hypothetical protein ABI891_12020 [Acidobacteriota bacterium]